MRQVNARQWRWPLREIRFAVIRYEAGQRMGRHVDPSPPGMVRRASVSVQLTPGSDYTDGDLTLWHLRGSSKVFLRVVPRVRAGRPTPHDRDGEPLVLRVPERWCQITCGPELPAVLVDLPEREDFYASRARAGGSRPG